MLFGALKLTKNFDKYGYSGYINGFGAVIIFLFDNSSFVHVDNDKKIFWIRISFVMLIITKVLGEGPTQELDDSTITAETKYPISFTQ